MPRIISLEDMEGMVRSPQSGPAAQFSNATPPPIPQRRVISLEDMEKQTASAPPAGPSPDAEKHPLKSIATGAKRGIDNLLGLPVDLARLVDSIGSEAAIKFVKPLLNKIGIPVEDEDFKQSPSDKIPLGSQDIREMRQKYLTGDDFEPQAATDKMIERGTEWAAFPTRSYVAAAAAGLGGVVSERLRQAGISDLPADIGGIAVGGGIAQGARSLGRTANPLAKTALKGVTPAEIDKAKAMQAQALQEGVPLTAAESLDNTQLQQTQDAVRSSQYGSKAIDDFMKARPQQVINALEQKITNLEAVERPKRLPYTDEDIAKMEADTAPNANLEYKGFKALLAKEHDDFVNRQRSLDDVAFRMAKAAKEGPIKAVVAERSSRASPLYEASRAEAAPRDEVTDVLGDIGQAAANAAPGGKTRRALNDLATRLQQSRTVGHLTSTVKELRSQMDNANDELFGNKEVKSVVGPFLSRLDDTLEAAGKSTYGQAQDIFRKESVERVNPALRSRTGQLADLFVDDKTPVSFSQVQDKVMGKGIEATQLKDLYRGINKKDPAVWPDFAQKYLGNKLNEVTKEVQTGLNPKLGINFRTKVIGTKEDKAKFKELMAGVAEANNLPPEAPYNAFMRIMDVLERTGKSAGTGSPTAFRQRAEELAGVGHGTAALEAANLTKGSLFATAQRNLRDYYHRRNYEEIARAVTSKDAVEQIQNLAKYGEDDPRLWVGIAGALHLLDEGQQQKDEKPPVRIDVQPRGGLE